MFWKGHNRGKQKHTLRQADLEIGLGSFYETMRFDIEDRHDILLTLGRNRSAEVFKSLIVFQIKLPVDDMSRNFCKSSGCIFIFFMIPG